MEFFIIITLLLVGFVLITLQIRSNAQKTNNSNNNELVQQIIDLKSELSAKEERIKILNEKIKDVQDVVASIILVDDLRIQKN